MMPCVAWYIERMPPAVAPASIAAWSAGALDRELVGDAELLVARVAGDAILLGAFQRRSDVSTELDVFRRASGGAAVRLGVGSLYVGLALRRHDALVACEAARMVNRYVRPLLRALTKCGAKAEYTGRDWVGVLHRPAGMVGFAHDATSGRALVEAVVGVTTPFAIEERASFLGKRPGTVVEIVGRDVGLDRIESAVAEAYPTATSTATSIATSIATDLPWTATATIPIGLLAAGRDASGTLRLGGDLMASRDAVASLEAHLAELAPDAAQSNIAAIIDATLGAPGVVVEGVTSLESVLDVILRGR
jgi:hypothetical protein